MTHVNFILNVDSYKPSMFKQYQPGTEYVSSYIESRGGRWDKTIYFGAQAFMREVLSKPITQEDIDEAGRILKLHGVPFNRKGWEYILSHHKGFMPLKIKSAPEGSLIQTSNVLLTVVNTDPECYWLTTYIETALMRAIWYPTTVATNSWHCRKIILKYLEETGDPAGIDFKLHDFGARGVSSEESAMLGGMAHLVNFNGTDTISGILGAMKYYDSEVCGFSVPAMEHSTVTSWGKDHEVDSYRNMLKQYAKPGSIVACVSDSYDIFNACEHIWGEQLKDEVVKSGAVVVIRPDSGDPVDVVSQCLILLEEKFGSVVNDKGFRVLNNVRVLQGDGIDDHMIEQILYRMKSEGFSADNVAFGMGSALLQKIDRDTLKFAMKCSAIKVNGVWKDVYKDPVGDTGKRSKRGRQMLIEMNGIWMSSRIPDMIDDEDAIQSELQLIYENGQLFNQVSFNQIRERARANS